MTITKELLDEVLSGVENAVRCHIKWDIRLARAMGFGVMVGCIVTSSVAIAPAVLLAQGVDMVDLDAPLLLAED